MLALFDYVQLGVGVSFFGADGIVNVNYGILCAVNYHNRTFIGANLLEGVNGDNIGHIAPSQLHRTALDYLGDVFGVKFCEHHLACSCVIGDAKGRIEKHKLINKFGMLCSGESGNKATLTCAHKKKLLAVFGQGLSVGNNSLQILNFRENAHSGGGSVAFAAQKAAMEARGATVYLVENPVVQISSTDLRRLLAFECAEEFLAPAVADFVRDAGLYNPQSMKNLSLPRLEEAVIRLLKPNRVAHVLGCRDTAVAMAERWGADPTDAARAALLHDVTKALDGPLQLTLCRAYGIILDDFSTHNPKTLHALTGSLVAQRIFGENSRVVSAIASHTTGKPGMSTLEKIIYVADYMEPNRDFPGVEKLRQLAFEDLTGALRLGLEMTLQTLKQEGKEISPESRQALAFITEN